MVATAANRASAGSPGARRWRPRCWPGARPTGSARATGRSPAGRRSASGGRREGPASSMSAQGLAFTSPFVVASTDPVRSWTTPKSGQHHLCRGFQQRQGARSQRRDRRAPTTRRRSRRSGRETPACTGIRRPTRWRAPTTCRCPTPTGCSPYSTSRWPTRHSPSGAPSCTTAGIP